MVGVCGGVVEAAWEMPSAVLVGGVGWEGAAVCPSIPGSHSKVLSRRASGTRSRTLGISLVFGLCLESSRFCPEASSATALIPTELLCFVSVHRSVLEHAVLGVCPALCYHLRP